MAKADAGCQKGVLYFPALYFPLFSFGLLAGLVGVLLGLFKDAPPEYFTQLRFQGPMRVVFACLQQDRRIRQMIASIVARQLPAT